MKLVCQIHKHALNWFQNSLNLDNKALYVAGYIGLKYSNLWRHKAASLYFCHYYIAWSNTNFISLTLMPPLWSVALTLFYDVTRAVFKPSPTCHSSQHAQSLSCQCTSAVHLLQQPYVHTLGSQGHRVKFSHMARLLFPLHFCKPNDVNI